MDYKEQITKAVGAHSMWKVKLKMAIETGKSDFNSITVKTDNNCDFGKWLHNDISPELKKSPIYNTVLKHHVEFHLEAGRILELALAGKKEEAQNGMKSSSKFTQISASLTATMMEWKHSLK